MRNLFSTRVKIILVVAILLTVALAILSGINLGLAYSGGQLISDDFVGENKVVSVTTKNIVMKLCREVGIDRTICTAEDVKVTVVQHEDGLLVFLINSAAAPRCGNIRLPVPCSSSETVYGSCRHTVQAQQLEFSLDSDQSAVICIR